MGRLEGSVGIVTGGASGIGRTTAILAAAEGARVVVADVDRARGEAVTEKIVGAGGEAAFIAADVTQEDLVAAMVRETVDRFGRLDWASNNAVGGERFSLLTQIESLDWDEFVCVALKGAWLCMMHLVPALIDAGGGAIVNLSSMLAVTGQPGLAAYAAACAGVVALSKSAAAEFAGKGVRVNAVQPGMIRTPRNEKFARVAPEIADRAIAAHALGRMGEPEEVARAILWLCSDQASFVTGECLAVDGGAQVKSPTYPVD